MIYFSEQYTFIRQHFVKPPELQWELLHIVTVNQLDLDYLPGKSSARLLIISPSLLMLTAGDVDGLVVDQPYPIYVH